MHQNFNITAEQKRIRDLIAPLLAADIIGTAEARKLASKELSSASLSTWKRREREKSLEEQEIRLIRAKLSYASLNNLQTVESIAPAQLAQESITAPLPQAQASAAAPLPSVKPVIAENTYDYISKIGINGLIDEVTELQALTVSNLQTEFKRLLKVEKCIDRLLKDKTNTPADLKSLIGTIEKCSELKRKIALMPFGSIDPNKQLNQQVTGPQAVHFHNHGAADYKPS